MECIYGIYIEAFPINIQLPMGSTTSLGTLCPEKQFASQRESHRADPKLGPLKGCTYWAVLTPSGGTEYFHPWRLAAASLLLVAHPSAGERSAWAAGILRFPALPDQLPPALGIMPWSFSLNCLWQTFSLGTTETHPTPCSMPQETDPQTSTRKMPGPLLVTVYKMAALPLLHCLLLLPFCWYLTSHIYFKFSRFSQGREIDALF